jgi:hypothetical protein
MVGLCAPESCRRWPSPIRDDLFGKREDEVDGANWTAALASVTIAVATGVNVWIIKRAAKNGQAFKDRPDLHHGAVK